MGSSSEGNSFYIEIYRKGYPNPFKLLIECGFAYNELSKRLLNKGISVRDLNAILITHEHQDHSKAIVDLHKKGKKIYAPRSVFEKYGLLDRVENKYIIEENSLKGIADGITVRGFPLEHENDDGSLTYNLGYIITVDREYRILFVTDTKQIRWDLSKYQFNLIFIEANNLRRVLHFSLKGAKETNNYGAQIHLKRVLKSHMLVEKTAMTLATFDLSKCDTIFLIHLSANLKTNIFEFKKVIRDKLTQAKKFRKVRITKNGKSVIRILPDILVMKNDGSIE